MKKKILIISGGISKEREISLQTGSQVAKELKKNGYKIKTCEPDYELFNITKKYKPNLIFNALHGQYGEDGYIQSIQKILVFHILIQELFLLQKQWIKKFLNIYRK